MRSWDVSKEGVHGLGAGRHKTGNHFGMSRQRRPGKCWEYFVPRTRKSHCRGWLR